MSSEVLITKNKFALDGAEEGLKKAILETAVQVHANAVSDAPVNKKVGIGGALRNSIMWRTSWEGDGGFNSQPGDKADERLSERPGELEAVVGTNVDYGVYQEFGTRFMPAQPFLRSAGDAVRGATAGEIAKKWGPEKMKEEFQKRTTTQRKV